MLKKLLILLLFSTQVFAGVGWQFGNGFTAGGSSQFSVDASGNLTDINGVPYTWPSSNSAGALQNNGSGTLTWSTSGLGITQLTGDVAAGPGSGSQAATLATVATAGTTGSSTSIPSITINAKGLTTSVTDNVVIAPAGTLSGTTLNSSVVTSSLTSVGTIGTGTWQGTAVGAGYGGTGLTGTPSNGQLAIGNGSGYALGTLTPGSGISVTNGAGSITVAMTPPAPVVAAGNTTVDATYYNKIVALNAASGAFNLTLPAASTMTNGFKFWIVDYTGVLIQTNNVTIVRNGSDFIGGIGANYIFNTAYGFVGLWTDSVGWYFF